MPSMVRPSKSHMTPVMKWERSVNDMAVAPYLFEAGVSGMRTEVMCQKCQFLAIKQKHPTRAASVDALMGIVVGCQCGCTSY